MDAFNQINALFDKLEGALAKNTIRAYQSDFADFAQWCLQQDINPLDHTQDDMLLYIEELAEEKATATITRRLASLSSIFNFLHITDTTKGTDMYLLIKKIKRAKGSAQLQATPLTYTMMQQLLAFCGENNTGLRNQVMLLLGHQTMRRRSELCRFQFDDIREYPGLRYGLQLRFSKTDQAGKGKVLPITSEFHKVLMNWHARVGDGFILRGVKGDFITSSLQPSSINRILQELQTKTGLVTQPPFSGHSFRVGGALDLLMDGVTMEKIMLRGGWSSESSVIRYLRAWDLMEE